MIQLNILDQFLDPLKDKEVDTSRDAMWKKIERDLLLKPNKVALAREPNFGPTWLLCATVWLKLSKIFLNQGTQKEACELFIIHKKQLSKITTGRKYFGGTDKKRPSDEDDMD